MEDLLVVSLFHPIFYLLEITGPTGFRVVPLAHLSGLQVVVEPVLSVADAAGQRVVYLVVTACLPVDDDGIVAVPNLLYGVLGRSLLFAQLASWVVCKEDIQSANAISWSALQLLSLLFRPLG